MTEPLNSTDDDDDSTDTDVDVDSAGELDAGNRVMILSIWLLSFIVDIALIPDVVVDF